MFDAWMHRNGLSLISAAEALGISRRTVSYYRTANKAIPRTIWLAQREDLQQGQGLPGCLEGSGVLQRGAGLEVTGGLAPG